MQKLKKIGRLAFLLPYIIVPFILMLTWHEDFLSSLIFSYCLTMGIEFPIILYPICWIVSIVCFVLCAKENKRNNDKKGKLVNRLLLAFAILWTIVHIATVIYSISSFTLA